MSKDRYKNERIELAREKVKNATTLEDIALIVTHEGLGLLNTTLENSMRRIIQEEIQKATKELALGFLKGMEPVKQLPEPKEEPRYDYKEFAAEPEEEPGRPTFDLWQHQAQLAEEKKQQLAAEKIAEKIKNKRKAVPWTEEEDQELLKQLQEWKQTGISDNKALGRVHLPDRTMQAIKYRYFSVLKER